MLGRLICQDIKYGIIKIKGRYAAFLLFMIIVVLGDSFYYESTGLGDFGLFGILTNSVLAGISTYVPSSDNPILIPAKWLVMILFIPFIMGEYCEEEQKGIGLYRIAITGRKKWWISKCLWIFANALAYLLIFFGVQLVVPTIINDGFVGIDREVWLYLSGYSDMIVDKMVFFSYTIAVPCLCIFAICVWSSVLGLIFGAVNSFVFITIYISMGLFYTSPYLIGNQLMLQRCSYFEANGLVAETSIIIDIILIIGGLLTGYSYIQNKNLI